MKQRFHDHLVPATWHLCGVSTCADQAEMPDLLGLIVQAMGLHSGAPEARGSPRHRATDTEGCPSA